jgi:hypothetical protein
MDMIASCLYGFPSLIYIRHVSISQRNLQWWNTASTQGTILTSAVSMLDRASGYMGHLVREVFKIRLNCENLTGMVASH